MEVIITAPSLDPTQNVSGVSSVVNFIIDNNSKHNYIHFELGKKDNERGGIFRIGAILIAYRRWKNTLASHPDALIHYSFPLSAMSIIRDFFFMRYAYKKERKMTIHIHGGNYLTATHIPLILNRLLKRVFTWDLPFIVLSEKEKQTVCNRFGAKHVEVLSNCVDLQDAQSYSREEKENNEVLTMGYLGRIEPKKGMKEFLEACMELESEGVPFKVVLAGKEEQKDEYLPKFKQLKHDSFQYMGVVSGKEKATFLKDIDIFVLPSYFEGLPMSLLECMSFGAVPIVTPVGSIPEVVEDGVNGLFIKVKDSHSIVEAIQRLNNERKLLCKLSKNARETILTQFSPENYVEKLNRIYENILLVSNIQK